MQTITDKRPAGTEFLLVIAGAAVGVGGVGAALALADIDSPLRAPFTLFFLLAAPASAIGATLRGLDPLVRPVLAVAGALALDLLVAQAMLALHLWSVRGGVVTVAALSLLILVPTLLVRRARRRRAGRGHLPAVAGGEPMGRTAAERESARRRLGLPSGMGCPPGWGHLPAVAGGEPKGRAAVERESARRPGGTSGRARSAVDRGFSAPEAIRASKKGTRGHRRIPPG
ncbi:hypothetical protein ABZS86_19250 [Streptomyces sp. NPDC005355]|uniref:hypothetical protein n=1 Tax=Streptomyces sp. NPDC005355 TaxID=3157038 RepID=UPI0033A03F78